MKKLNLKILVFLMAATIATSGCSIWDPIFRPHQGEHKGDHDRDHKGDHDRDHKNDHKGDHDYRNH